MSSGTVFAMSSTFAAFAAVVSVVGPEVSVFFVHPDSARAPDHGDDRQRRATIVNASDGPDIQLPRCLFFLHRVVIRRSSRGR